MRKLLLLAVAALVVTVAPAAAKTVTIAITKAGYVPKSATIAAGDSVSFVNQDTVAHQVVLKPTTGVTCTANPLVIQPGQTATCTFRTAGTYAFSDATIKKAAFKGTITVTAAGGGGPVTLQVTPTLLTYGGKVTLSGTLGSGQANQKVSIFAGECGSTTFKQVATATTTTGGSYTTTLQPLKSTTYEARSKSTRSAQSSVRVRPAVRLARTARRHFAVRVTAAQSFVGKVVVFQRYRATLRRWVRVRTVTLARTVPAVSPTVITTAAFRARVRSGLRVRVVVPAAQAAPCYAAARSNTVRS
jgi:plastocyanin